LALDVPVVEPAQGRGVALAGACRRMAADSVVRLGRANCELRTANDAAGAAAETRPHVEQLAGAIGPLHGREVQHGACPVAVDVRRCESLLTV
jgi:hypothetical protein